MEALAQPVVLLAAEHRDIAGLKLTAQPGGQHQAGTPAPPQAASKLGHGTTHAAGRA